jgi:hypothetical protein
MSQLIYKAGPWLIEQDPTMAARPDLVRFVKRGPSGRKTLDQIAQWTGTGWDRSRWIPRPPMVSRPILDLVERHMQGVQR